MNRTSIVCFAIALTVFVAGIPSLLTLRYSYARHERALHEIPGVFPPTDADSTKALIRYALRRGTFGTEELVIYTSVVVFIALVFGGNGWSHHRRLQRGEADSTIKVVIRICVWLLAGFVFAGFAMPC